MDGRELRALRLAAGLSQRELARRTGLHETTIGKLECRGVQPSRRTERRLLRALGLAPPAPTHAADGARYIELDDGSLAAVDEQDFERLGAYNWRLDPDGYARRKERGMDGTWRNVRLHREILGAPDGLEVHHIDNDGLNNRRTNLVTMTPAEHRRLHRQQDTP